MRRLATVCALLWLVALAPACGTEPTPTLPPLQELAARQALPVVEEQIRRAWEWAGAHPDDAAASGELGMVLSAYGRSQQARDCYLRARRLDPTEFRWPYFEAISLGDLGRTDEAIAVMNEALSLRPAHVEGRIRLARWLTQAGDPAGARAVFEAVLGGEPRRGEALLGLAQMLLEQGDAAAAVRPLRVLLEIDWQIGEVHYTLSRALLLLGDRTGAEQHAALFQRFKKRRLHINDPLIKEVTELNLSDKPHLTRAAWFREQGRLEDAVAAVEAALAVNPRNASAHLDLMELYAQGGRMDAAEAQYRLATSEVPDDPEAHARWARLQRVSLDYAGAATAFARALALAPDRPDLLSEAGFVLEQQGLSVEAAERYRQALKSDSEHQDAHAGLGRLLLASGDPKGAIPHLERAVGVPGAKRARLLYRLALARAAVGLQGDARKALEEARPLAAAAADPHLAAEIDQLLGTLEPNGSPSE